jgi:hypothetical protein
MCGSPTISSWLYTFPAKQTSAVVSQGPFLDTRSNTSPTTPVNYEESGEVNRGVQNEIKVERSAGRFCQSQERARWS